MEELKERILMALQEIRPFLERDRGDIELIDVTDDMTDHVKLLGACRSCSMSAMTLRAGVEESIKRVAPEIRSVVAVED